MSAVQASAPRPPVAAPAASSSAPGLSADERPAAGAAPPRDLGEAAPEQHQHQPGAEGGRGERAQGRVDDQPPAVRARPAAPGGGGEAQPGVDRDGRHRGPGPGAGPAQPVGRRAGQEERRQRHDQHEPGEDEAEAADDGPGAPAQRPGAVDGQLGRRRPGQEVGRRDRVLEPACLEPAPALHAKLAQQRDVRRRPAEADDADPAPLARHLPEARGRAGPVGRKAGVGSGRSHRRESLSARPPTRRRSDAPGDAVVIARALLALRARDRRRPGPHRRGRRR